jgi:class 3 adenylate cyclase/thioredoxin-like negative regulator of GroEL
LRSEEDVSEIRGWLEGLGLGRYADAFEAHEITPDLLPDLSDEALERLGVAAMGHRLRVLRAVAAERELGGTPRWEGERRRATVLFSDLSGYTAMSEALDPEEVESVMVGIKADATRIVERHGGIVNQFVGDEVVAVFGIPVTHDDDPVRAVRAAVELHDAVRARCPKLEERLGRRVRLHTGVNTGLVVAHPAEDPSGRFVLTGDAVNTGARLRGVAEADEILLGPETERLTREFFRTEAGAPVELKGKSAPVAPARVVGATDVASRFEAAEERGLTRYEGRAAELASLRACLERALGGQGQLVTVSGEPGLGKSRLLFEFRRSLGLDRVRVLQGRCQSFGSDVSYLPFVEVLEAALQLDGAVDDGREERVAAAVLSVDPALERYLPYYLQLLSISSERYRLPARFMGEEKRRAFEESLVALLTLLSRERPLVLMLEDWHWADEASDSTLHYLAGAIAGAPILATVSHRPSYGEGWGSRGHHTELALKPLEAEDTGAMVASCLGAARLPDGLGRLVHARTDGNPLFVEEICRALLEDGTVRVEDGEAALTRPLDDLALPETVQAVIRSRLDRLDPQLQGTLGLASVIGREFERAVLERLHSDPGRLDASLSALVAQDLIHQVRVVPEVEYAFKHVLTQVVAYETLLLGRRRELHRLVGRAIEELHAGRLPQLAEALAHHFDLGEVWGKATTYRIRAGVKAHNHHVLSSALEHFERAEAILAAHAPEIGWRDRHDLAFAKGSTLGDRGAWPAAYREISAAEAVAEEHGDRDLLVQTLLARANAAFWAHLFDESLAISQRVERMVGDDPPRRLAVTSTQAISNFMCERLDTTLEKERQLAELFRQVPDAPQSSRAAFVLGVFHRWRGDNRTAAEYLDVAVQRDRETASAGVYLQSLMHYCLAIGELGRYQEAIDLLREGREYGERADSLYGVLKIDNTLGWAFQEICNFEEAVVHNQASLLATSAAKGSDTSTLSELDSFGRLNLGDLHQSLGEIERAREYYETTYENVGETDYFLARTRWEARCLLGLGEVSVVAGDVGRAEELLSELDVHGFTERFPFKKHRVRALRLRAGVAAAHGEAAEAARLLEEAIAVARAVGNPPQLWKTQLALAEVLERVGRREEARAASAAAREAILGVAEGLGEPLRRPFLAAAPIREALAKADAR